MTIIDQEVTPKLRRPERAVVAWLRLVRVYHKIDAATADRLRKHRLTVAQFDVLAQVGAREGQTQQELAASLLVTKSNVCQVLARMETAGWIERRHFGRANRLYLTPKGRSLFDDVVLAHEGIIADRLGALSSEEQITLLRLLRTLDRSL
ncbi:MAG: MarR family transcriptional regulator [Chloroflexi bacterium]|nr:MarR family transcriptional regulator [Chloroflexota bacterium]